MTRTPEDPAGDAVRDSPGGATSGGAGAHPTDRATSGGATSGSGADAVRPRGEPLTDDRLRVELDRRWRGRGGAVPTDRIAAVVHDRIAVTPQEPRWRLQLRAWAPRIGVAATVVAALLVVALAGPPLLTDIQRSDIQRGGPGTHWDPAERPLTAEELGRLFPRDGSNPFAGRIVIAEVGLVGVLADCVDLACDLAVEGIDPEILVHYDPARTGPARTTDETLAFRVREDRGLDLIERVRSAPLRLAWSVPGLADEMRRVDQFDRAVQAVYLVDAWLVGSPPPSCPAPFPLDSLPPPPGLDVGCGPAAWLTPTKEQPVKGDANSSEVGAPQDGLRVQNGAYDAFAPDPVRGPYLPGIETPRHGLYLVRRHAAGAESCFMCTPLGSPVEIVARVDPLTIPAGPSTTMPPATPFTSTWNPANGPLSPKELFLLVRAAADGGPRGTVVARVRIQPTDLIACENGLPPCRDAVIVLDDGSTSIDVVGWRTGSWSVVVPGGPELVALGLRDDRAVLYLGPVAEPPSGGGAWTVPQLLAEPQPLAGSLYLVDAWIVDVAPLRCRALIGTTPPEPNRDVSCVQPGWLTPTAEQPSRSDPNERSVVAPLDGIRVQNGAYEAFAPDPVLSVDRPPRHGIFLVRPFTVGAGECFICSAGGPVEVVARVDPLVIPSAPSSSRSPDTPVASGSVSSAPPTPAGPGAPTSSPAGSVAVPVTVTIDDPGWNRLADPKFAVTTCRGASDCGHVDEIYPGIDFSGMDVDFSQAFVLRVAGGVPISAAWEGRTLTITVRARTGGFAQATILN